MAFAVVYAGRLWDALMDRAILRHQMRCGKGFATPPAYGTIAMLLVVAEWACQCSDHHARPGGDAEEGLWRRAIGGCEWGEPERQRQCAGWPRVRQSGVDGALCSCTEGG